MMGMHGKRMLPQMWAALGISTLFLMTLLTLVGALPSVAAVKSGSLLDWSAVVSPADVRERVVISCPTYGQGGDGLGRGFYVVDYPATNLGRVEMVYWAFQEGTYAISMTVRRDTYDGPIVGTQVITLELPARTSVTGTFDFGGVSVPQGSTLTFIQAKVVGPGNVYYNRGPCSGGDVNCHLCPGIYQTEGTHPPLDTFRRRSVALRITAYSSTGWMMFLPWMPEE